MKTLIAFLVSVPRSWLRRGRWRFSPWCFFLSSGSCLCHFVWLRISLDAVFALIRAILFLPGAALRLAQAA